MGIDTAVTAAVGGPATLRRKDATRRVGAMSISPYATRDLVEKHAMAPHTQNATEQRKIDLTCQVKKLWEWNSVLRNTCQVGLCATRS